MKYEVIESCGEWIVVNDGQELARFAGQAEALDHVAACLRNSDPGSNPVSLRVRYEARG